jgi:hypothetical protein
MYARSLNRQANAMAAQTKREIADRIKEAGKRAREEADARRKAEKAVSKPEEHGGQKGPEPTRYGDWEKNGLISDF